MSDTPEQEPIIGFPDSNAVFHENMAECDVDYQSFNRPISRCADCRGMCCYHGAHLTEDQATVVRQIVEENRDWFAGIGLDLPEECVVEGVWRGEPSGPKTAVAPRADRAEISNWPAHWEHQACVFLDENGFCGLQRFSEACGKHPWFYKPVTCWLHPINFPEEGPMVVYGEEDDPTIYDDYPGFNTVTGCGKPCPGGRPAYEVLAQELTFLGRFSERDLLSEIANELGGEVPQPDGPKVGDRS